LAVVMWFLYVIRDVIAILFIAVLITSLIEPAVDWMQRKKISRGLGIILIYFIAFGIIGLSTSFIIPPVIDQIKDFSQKAPEYFSLVDGFFQGINNLFISPDSNLNLDAGNFFGVLNDQLTGFSGKIFTASVNVFSGLISFIMVLVLVFYMTIREDGIKNFIVSIVPKKHEEYTVSLVVRIKDKIGKWMQGQLIVMVMIFLLDFLWLWILGVPYALVLALLAGILEIVPFFGPIISAIPGVFLAFLISPWKGLIAILLYTGIQQLEGNVIVPQIMKKATGLNPIVVILSLLIGFQIGGVLGAILVIPIVTGLNVALGDLMKKEDTK
jgi:predicted PurR-regulated permease PerM